MGLTKPVNENYCASIVRLRSIIKLENCDNLVHTNIFGNMVIVSKDTDDNAVGIYFPPECQLSPEFLSNNNLYRHSELNVDEETKGYFEDNGRVRTIKLRGNKSMGLFMPLSSLSFTEHTENLKVGDEFDQINGIPICKKYVVRRMQGMGGKGKKDRKPKVSKLMDNQFRFHYDTSQLGKNIHVIHPDDLISLTLKLHGTSVVISKLLCKKKLNIFHRFLRWLKVPIIDTHYENIYSSRKVVKNDELNPSVNSYYDEDVWEIANNRIYPFIDDGMTIYAEIVGFLPSGGYIQKGFDYGCVPGELAVYIYRITYTNHKGRVYEFSARQVQEWCKLNGLKAVPELYYGYAKDFFRLNKRRKADFGEQLLESLKDKYLEVDCDMCNNKVPREGIVLRVERTGEAYKLKSFNFLKRETEMLDKGEEDIEEQTVEE